MSRPSASSLATLAVTVLQRLDPPDDLSDLEQGIWQDVVNAKPADWFPADSVPLLKEYCRAAVMCDRLAVQVAEELAKGEMPFNVLKLRDMESKRLLLTGTKLRLTQQSRYTPKAASTANKKAGAALPWQEQKAA